ncbi:MAG: hypothetical protein R3A79_23000 [Nannocystaceae bacterium]
MEREQVLLSLLWIPALPLLAAAIGRLLEPRLRRDPAVLQARALQLAAGSTALTALLAGSAIGQLLRDDGPTRIIEELWSWMSVGTTTTLRAVFVMDPLGGVVIAGLLLVVFLAQLVAAGRPRQLLGMSVALSAALLITLAKSLALIALGWHALGIVALFAGEGPTRRRIRALALADGALWLAFGAMTYAAGAPELELVLRSTERLKSLELAGAPLAVVAGAGLVVAIVARAVGAASATSTPDRGPLAALLAGLTLLPAAYLLLRLSPIFALDAGLTAAVAASGALLLLLACARALAAPCPRATLAHVGLAQLGLVLVAAGVGAWLPALLIAGIAAVTQLGLRAAEASIDAPGETHRPWTRLGAALCGLAATSATPLGLLPPLGAVTAAAWTRGGAGVALAIALIAAAGALAFAVARALRRLFADAPGRAREEPAVAVVATSLGVVGLALGALHLPAIPGLVAGESWLEPHLRPALRQAEQLAATAPPSSALLGAMTFALLLAAWVGIALGRRLPAAAASRDPVARLEARLRPALRLGAAVVAAPGALVDHLERLLGALRLWIAGRIWLADGRPGARVVVMLVAGVGLTLAPVYCNPDVIVVGPTGVHPVDLGGLDPLIMATKKTLEEKLRTLEAPKRRLAPPDPETTRQTPRMEDSGR